MRKTYPGWQANDPALNGIGFFYSSTPGEMVSMIGGALLGGNGNLFYYSNGGNYNPMYLHRLVDSGWDFFAAGNGFGDMVEMPRQQADLAVMAQLGSAVAGLFRNGSGFTDPEATVNLTTAITAGLVFAPPGSTYEVVSQGFKESLGESGAAVAGGVAEIFSWFARAGMFAKFGIVKVVELIAGMGTSGKVLGMVGDRLVGSTGDPITLDQALVMTGAPTGVDPTQRNVIGIGADGVLRVVDVTDSSVNVYAYAGTQRYRETWSLGDGSYELRNGGASYVTDQSGKYLLLDGGPDNGAVRVDIPTGAEVKPFGAGGFKFEYTDSEGFRNQEIVRLNGDYSLALKSSSGTWVETSRGNYVDPNAANLTPDWDNGLLGTAAGVFGIYRAGGMYEYARDDTALVNGAPVSYREYVMKDAVGKPVEWLQVREDGTASLIQAHSSISFNAFTRNLSIVQDNTFGNGTVGLFRTDQQGHPVAGYAALTVGSGTEQKVLRVDFGLNENGDSEVKSVKFANGSWVANEAEVVQNLNTIGFSPRNVTTLDQDEPTSLVTDQAKDILGTAASWWSQFTGAQTLFDAIGQYGGTLTDGLSIIRAIQSGEPLPILASGLRLANDLTNLNNLPNLQLSGASNIASGVLSLLSLDAALERGDTLAAVTAGAQAIGFGAQAFADFAAEQTLMATTTEEIVASQLAYNEASALAGSIGNALPVLSIVNSLAHGDVTGAAVSAMSMMGVPYIGWAYAVYSIVSSLFSDDDIPDPWGSGRFVWDGSGIRVQAAGETGGYEAVSGVMNGVLSTMNALIERAREQNPGSRLGLIPNRMPSLGYGMDGFHYADIDPLTGAQKNPSLRYDTSGRPYNAEVGSPESYQSLGEAFIRSALGRGAIAPEWEVLTAKIQTEAGDPQAGLTEEERAGRAGQLAASPAGGGGVQLWRPVALDLDGDGIETIAKDASGVAFDVDDSGFLKGSAWLGADDAFLTLDRNYNGHTDSGKELFSNGTVALERRGLAGLAWVDADGDRRLTAADSVFGELRVWRDADSDGVVDAGEEHTLAELGITELDYGQKRYVQNGEIRRLDSPDLEADAEGARVNAVPGGILVEASGGQVSLLVNRIDDKSLLEPGRDGLLGYEDVETIVSGADLLANDSLAGFLGRDLAVTSVANAAPQNTFAP